MTFWQFGILLAAVGGSALGVWLLCGTHTGSAPCVGCGQCVLTGVCVLTGKCVDPRKMDGEKRES